LANYYVGSEARCTGIFRDAAGALGDPTTVVVMVQDPTGKKTTYTSGIVRDGVGVYHFDVLLTKPGSWIYKFRGSGGLNAASVDASIPVGSSVFGNA
jgi:hypothetical protein